jgi:hypothetical protein
LVSDLSSLEEIGDSLRFHLFILFTVLSSFKSTRSGHFIGSAVDEKFLSFHEPGRTSRMLKKTT